MSLPIEWRTNTKYPALYLLDAKDPILEKKIFLVEQGYYVFMFKPEDSSTDVGCLISTKEISFTHKE
jgi:hypothetical protein